MTPMLLIGYGNSLRRDDGAGLAVVMRFANCPKVEVITCHQLIPELATRLVSCERVVFVDAKYGGNTLECQALRPSTTYSALGHIGDPEWLLRLTLVAYGSCPEALLVTVPIQDVGFGEGFSPQMLRSIDAAVEMIQAIIKP